MTDKEKQDILDKPLYRFKVSLNNKQSYNGTAFVKEPAIQTNFQYFNEVKISQQKFESVNEEKRICSGFLMIADLPILRIDEKTKEYYYGIFTKEDIFNISIIMHQNGKINNTNQEHNPNMLNGDKVCMIESFIIDSQRGIYPPKTFENIPDGSLFASFKVFDDKIWEDVKNGTFNGFSIEGLFETVELKKEKSLLDELIDIANQIID